MALRLSSYVLEGRVGAKLGDEVLYAELGEPLATDPGNVEKRGEIMARYGFEVDVESLPGLIEEFGVEFPMPDLD